MVTFNGREFARYPDAENRSHRVYFSPLGPDARGVESLHREIWKDIHGPIPTGCDIHHADLDPLNNDPSNLVCVTRAEHRAIHGPTRTQEDYDQHLAAIRPLATEWHRSEEGRAWHREHGSKMWDGPGFEYRTIVCAQCGEEFQSRSPNPVALCSTKCRNLNMVVAERHQEDRVCPECAGTFRISKYMRTVYCGRSCASKVKARARKAATS